MTEEIIDHAHVTEFFNRLGVTTGARVCLHTRVQSMPKAACDLVRRGGEEGLVAGINTLIDAISAATGTEGILAVPTFSYCFKGSKNGAYDPAKSKSNTGLLTEIFRKRPDAVRSLQPTHSVAAIGKGAGELCAGHEEKTPLGVDSPLHRLAMQGGWIVYFGTSADSFSLLHVAETVADLPMLGTFNWAHIGWGPVALVETAEGVRELPLRQVPGCSRSFGVFDTWADEEGLFRRGTLYGSSVSLIKAKDALDLAVDKLKADPSCLLCPEGTCEACNVRRAATD